MITTGIMDPWILPPWLTRQANVAVSSKMCEHSAQSFIDHSIVSTVQCMIDDNLA